MAYFKYQETIDLTYKAIYMQMSERDVRTLERNRSEFACRTVR
jgi:hypothetical protein